MTNEHHPHHDSTAVDRHRRIPAGLRGCTPRHKALMYPGGYRPWRMSCAWLLRPMALPVPSRMAGDWAWNLACNLASYRDMLDLHQAEKEDIRQLARDVTEIDLELGLRYVRRVIRVRSLRRDCHHVGMCAVANANAFEGEFAIPSDLDPIAQDQALSETELDVLAGLDVDPDPELDPCTGQDPPASSGQLRTRGLRAQERQRAADEPAAREGVARRVLHKASPASLATQIARGAQLDETNAMADAVTAVVIAPMATGISDDSSQSWPPPCELRLSPGCACVDPTSGRER